MMLLILIRRRVTWPWCRSVRPEPRRAAGWNTCSWIPTATTEQVHQTVDRATVNLRTESAAWLSSRVCAACHHVPMPLWALSEAERQGYTFDKKWVVETTRGPARERGKS